MKLQLNTGPLIEDMKEKNAVWQTEGKMDRLIMSFNKARLRFRHAADKVVFP